MQFLVQAAPIVLVIAAFCLLLEAFNVTNPKVRFGWLGLFFLCLYLFFLR